MRAVVVPEAIIVLGVLICLVSLLAVALPARLLQVARKVTVSTALRLLAFIIRTTLGVFLILVAPSTDFPVAMTIIGILLIVSGIAALVLGNERIQGLLNWAVRLRPAYVVAGGLVGLSFGAFLIYVGA
jgi:uncharacterized membrane protein YidH (DUF202 family)